MAGLGDLAGGNGSSFAEGINSDGSAIVGNSGSSLGSEAFLWTQNSGMSGLGILPGRDSTTATDINDDGSVVVGYARFPSKAFIWDDRSGMRSLKAVLHDEGLDLTGWTLKRATAISDDGTTVVGFGDNPAGNREAFRATLDRPAVVPTPSVMGGGFALLGLLAGGGVLRKWRASADG